MLRTGKWSGTETEALLRLVAEKLGKDDVARQLQRTPGAVEARLRWLEMSTEDRDSMNARKVEREAAIKAGKLARRQYVHNTRGSPRATPELFEARDRRYAAPLSLSAYVFGDPPAGYSALDRRTGRQPTEFRDTTPTVLPIGAPRARRA